MGKPQGVFPMSNQKNGARFETTLKRILNDNGLSTLNLGYNETADLVVIDGKARLIECKVSHKPIWYRKNKAQYYKLIKFVERNKSVYIAIQFILKHKAIIRFYYLKDSPYPYRVNEGYSLEDFIKHCKEE